MMDAKVYNHNQDGAQSLDNRQQPLNPPIQSANAASLNDRLNTAYIDIPQEDNSLFASLTRGIVNLVGTVVTPRQMLGFLRVLKAITLSFLALTIAANVMYMCLLEIFSSDIVRTRMGGSRDTVLRVYGLILTFLAVGIELDVSKISKLFLGLKGFIPRGMLLFFIATLTRAHPIAKSFNDNSSISSNNNNGGDDDAYAGDDDDGVTDDTVYKMQQEALNLPYSAIAFQQVVSYILAICALVYLTFGVLCFDRFTSKAFLSTKNPLVTTAIPQPNNNQSDYSQPTPVYPQGNENEDLDYSVEDSRGDDMT